MSSPYKSPYWLTHVIGLNSITWDKNFAVRYWGEISHEWMWILMIIKIQGDLHHRNLKCLWINLHYAVNKFISDWIKINIEIQAYPGNKHISLGVISIRICWGIHSSSIHCRGRRSVRMYSVTPGIPYLRPTRCFTSLVWSNHFRWRHLPPPAGRSGRSDHQTRQDFKIGAHV